MIKGRIIVCLASSWDYDPTSKHQVMKILSRHNDIVWVDYHGTRRPALGKADLRAGCSVLRRFLHGVHRAGPSIFRVTPLVIPGVSRPFLRSIHQRVLVAQINRAVRAVPRAKEKPLQVWSFAPDVPYLVGQFNEECFVYYCVDEHSEFEGVDAAKITEAENELIDRADIVVTTAEALFRRKRTRRPDTVLVRHGVDFDHFAAAWRSPLPRPADLASVPGPIFGFFGLVHFWIDTGLIAEVASLRPKYSFVLIGDCRTDVSRLRQLPNVYLLGRRANEELPAYCAAFDAGLMPFTRTPMTQNVNPIKMYEYLAAGLPVVSTPLPEAEPYRGPITITDTPERFAEACDEVLATDYPGRRKAISRVVEGASWLSKAELLSDIITARLRPRIRSATMPVGDVVFPAERVSDKANVGRWNLQQKL